MKKRDIRFASIPSTEEVAAERERLAYQNRYQRVLRSTVYILVVVAAAAVLLATLFLPVLQVSGDSMNPTLNDKDIIQLYLNRDQRALSATAKKYGKYCTSIAKNILGNNEDAEEETQLTLGHDPLTKEGIKELKELFTSLANEFDTKPNRVTYIHIVATAQTDKELEAMGY